MLTARESEPEISLEELLQITIFDKIVKWALESAMRNGSDDALTAPKKMGHAIKLAMDVQFTVLERCKEDDEEQLQQNLYGNSPVVEVNLTDDLADYMVNPPTDPEYSDEETLKNCSANVTAW